MPASAVSRLLIDGLSIVLEDLLLAGDNALVIAMAVRGLPQSQRRVASIFGAAAAVILRIGLTVVASRLLGIEFLKMAGGALILWIAVKVLTDAATHAADVPARGSMLHAIWLIVFADITMSIDNVLAIAGTAHGNALLIIFGLCVSIPFVVFASNMTAKLMDRVPLLVYLGAAVLGKVGAEMILTDPFVAGALHPSPAMTWIAEGITIAAILVVGRYLCSRKCA